MSDERKPQRKDLRVWGFPDTRVVSDAELAEMGYVPATKPDELLHWLDKMAEDRGFIRPNPGVFADIAEALGYVKVPDQEDTDGN